MEVELTPCEKKIVKAIRDTCVKYDQKVVPRIAGGWVRDKQQEQPSQDMDISLEGMNGETFANYLREYILSIEDKNTVSTIGIIKSNPTQSKHLDTATIQVYGYSIDINNQRTEIYNGITRIPLILLGTPYEDAMRRDFTINTLFYNIITEKIEDICGNGIDDLKQGELCTPLTPYKTFNDDPLRVLRCARFSGRFCFIINPDIYYAVNHISLYNNLFRKVSRERIGIELKKIFQEFGYVFIGIYHLCIWGLRPILFTIPIPQYLNNEYNNNKDTIDKININCTIYKLSTISYNSSKWICPIFIDPSLLHTNILYKQNEFGHTCTFITHDPKLLSILRAYKKRDDITQNIQYNTNLLYNPIQIQEDTVLTSFSWTLLYLFHQSLIQLFPYLVSKDNIVTKFFSDSENTTNNNSKKIVPISTLKIIKKRKRQEQQLDNTNDTVIKAIFEQKQRPIEPTILYDISTNYANIQEIRRCDNNYMYIQFKNNTVPCSPIVCIIKDKRKYTNNNTQILLEQLKKWKPEITQPQATGSLLSSFLWLYNGYRIYKKSKKNNDIVRYQSCQTLIHSFIMDSIKLSTSEYTIIENFCNDISEQQRIACMWESLQEQQWEYCTCNSNYTEIHTHKLVSSYNGYNLWELWQSLLYQLGNIIYKQNDGLVSCMLIVDTIQKLQNSKCIPLVSPYKYAYQSFPQVHSLDKNLQKSQIQECFIMNIKYDDNDLLYNKIQQYIDYSIEQLPMCNPILYPEWLKKKNPSISQLIGNFCNFFIHSNQYPWNIKLQDDTKIYYKDPITKIGCNIVEIVQLIDIIYGNICESPLQVGNYWRKNPLITGKLQQTKYKIQGKDVGEQLSKVQHYRFLYPTLTVDQALRFVCLLELP